MTRSHLTNMARACLEFARDQRDRGDFISAHANVNTARAYLQQRRDLPHICYWAGHLPEQIEH